MKESDLTKIEVKQLLLNIEELIRLLTAIVKTSQRNLTKN